MFKKEGSFSKTNGKKAKDTPLKKSDRRKLRDSFLAIIGNTTAAANDETDTGTQSITKEQLDFIFLDSKSDVSIRKLKLKNVNSNAGATNIYSRSPSSSIEEDAALWPYTKFSQVLLMQVDNVTIPSLALLSILPAEILNSLPTMVVPPIVSKYLCRGADLMRSGIISMPSKHHGWCVIRAMGNQQPFAVGFVTNGTDPSSIGAETKGVGLQVVTCYGDEIHLSQMDPTAKPLDRGRRSEIGGGIFDNGNYGNVGFIDGNRVYGLVSSDEGDSDDSGEENDEGVIEKAMGEVALSSDGADNTNTIDDGKSNSEAEVEAEAASADDSDTYEEEDSMDTILLKAFHDAVVRISKKQLPLPTSTFYSQHVLPARKEGSFIDLKATRYKKIGTFLSQQAAKGIIKLGAANGDAVAFVNAVDRTHIDLREARTRKNKEGESDSHAGDQTGKNKLALATLYIIPNWIVNLMHLNEDDVKAVNAKSDERRGTGYLTTPECRDILNRYVVDNSLVDEFDPENITLDGPLCDAVFRKTKKELQHGKNEYQESVTRKELNIKWLEKMEKAYAIVELPGSKIISMKRGLPPKITFVVESRQSRKKFITRVRGVEEVRDYIYHGKFLFLPSLSFPYTIICLFKTPVWNKSK